MNEDPEHYETIFMTEEEWREAWKDTLYLACYDFREAWFNLRDLLLADVKRITMSALKSTTRLLNWIHTRFT